jgi:hypothetical protein
VNPTPQVLPGVASVYNTASTPVLINQYNSLNQAMNTALGVSGGATIKLTAGTYTDLVGSYGTAGSSVVTIQGTDPSAANVIIKSTGNWTLTGKTFVIDSVTINGKTGTGTVVASSSATVSNSNITTGALTIGATGTGTSNITKDTFTVATGANGLTPSSATTVTGSTFNLTGQGGYGILTNVDVSVTGSTFTGSTNTTDQYLGNGIEITGSTSGSSISSSTFTGLSNALTLNGAGAMATFSSNTVTNCGQAPASGNSTAAIIITAAAANGVNIYGNTITNGAYYIITVAAGQDGAVNIYQNTFTGNAKVASGDPAATLSMVRNWWGSAANVPANVKQVGTTAGYTFTPALGAAPSAAAFGITGNLSASATVGVNVYGQTLTGGNLTTGATVDFYGTTASPVVNTATSQSAVLFYNSVTGSWVNAGGSINTYGNYVEIYVGTTSGSVVTDAQFNGTPFVLVTVAIHPSNGATGIPINKLTFTWPAVSGSGITYQFALAQASANTSANWFAILDYSDNTTTNAEPSQEILQPNTIYWWEVRAVTMNSSGGIAATGPWTVSTFTTAPAVTATTSSAAVTITQPITSIVVTQPVTTVQSTVTSVVITQTTGTSSQAIPSYLLWAVIAVGAILVIAVIVLIVRTRRIP